MQEYIKKILGSGHHNNTTTLIISNNEIEDIRGGYWNSSNEVKEQKGGFLSMLLGTLGASLLQNILTGWGINRAGKGWGINKTDEGIVTAGYGNNKIDFYCHPIL